MTIAVSGAVGVSAGGIYDDYCAILAGGAVACWGANNYGQLGDGTTVDRWTTPVMTVGISGVVSVGNGLGWTTCGALASGELFCWGFNGNGELGNGTATNSSVPVPVTPAAPGPRLTLPDDLTIVAPNSNGIAATFSATAADYPSGNPLAATCSPRSGTVFPMGRWLVTCTATGAGGGSATASFSVNVVVTPPDAFPIPPRGFLPDGSAGYLAEATSPAGAASFSGGTTTDIIDGSVPVLCRPGSEVMFPVGLSIQRGITCYATNARGATRSIQIPGRVRVFVQDTTPPEAVISLDPATRTLSVTGTDTGSGSVGPFAPTCAPEVKKAKDDDHGVGDDDKDNKVQLCTYLLTDNSGNTTTLVVRQKQSGKQIKASAVSIQYGAGAVTTLPANFLSFEWSLNKDGSIKELNEKLTTGKDKTKIEVEAKYHDGKSDVTRVKANLPGNGQDVKVTVPGIVLLRLSTANGALSIAY